MKRLAFFNFLVFTFFIASCTGDKEVMAVLDKAEGYLPDYPDSACAVLDSVPTSLLSREGLALYGLLHTMSEDMVGKGVTTDSLIRSTYIYYYKKRSGTDLNLKRLGRSAFYLARFEASRDSTKRAEDLFREAIKYSEKVEDWHTCYIAYSWLAREKSWSDLEEAIHLYEKAIDTYHKVEDKPDNFISMLLSLSNNYLALQHYNQSLDYANKAYDIAQAENLDIQKFSALRRLAVIYYETGEYTKALELAKLGMHELTDRTRDAALFSLADCYLACDSLEQAKSTLLQIKSPNIKLRYSINNTLCKIAILQHNASQSIEYFDSLNLATGDMFTNIQQTKEDYYNDNIKKELFNEQLIHKKKQQAVLLWGAGKAYSHRYALSAIPRPAGRKASSCWQTLHQKPCISCKPVPGRHRQRPLRSD